MNKCIHRAMTIHEQTYRDQSAWGMSTAIDLHGCDPTLIRSAEAVKQFVVELADLIKVKRFGDCTVVHFGDSPEIAGFSMTQLIETSLISGHFVNATNAVYLDVFSCRYYDPEMVSAFAARYFKAHSKHVQVLLRI